MSSPRPKFSSPLTRDHLGVAKSKKSNKRDPNHERNEAKRARLQAEDDEEKRLTNLLFGGDGGEDGSAWHDDDDENDDFDEIRDSQEDNGAMEEDNGDLFQIDRTGTGTKAGIDSEDDMESQGFSGDENENNSDISSQENKNEAKSSAWVDDDDENVTVSLAKTNRIKKLRSSMVEDEIQGSSYEKKLRERHEATAAVTSRTDWAQLPQEDDDSGSDSDEDETTSKLLSSTAPLLSNSRLQPNILNVVRCPDANVGHYNSSAVQAVQFHPGSDEDSPLMLTAGLDKTLRFFKINGTEGSEKIHGIHFPNLPIHSADFLGDSGSVVVSGRRPFFYIYDVAAGKVSRC